VKMQWYEIVGVVADYPLSPMEPDAPTANVYHPIANGELTPTLLRVEPEIPFDGRLRRLSLEGFVQDTVRGATGRSDAMTRLWTLMIAAPFEEAAGFTELFSEWPGPIVAAGEDIRQVVHFPGESIEKDFEWAMNHPLIDAYRAVQTTPYDVPSSTMAAILNTVHPEENYFKLSQAGTLAFFGHSLLLTTNPQGRHRLLIADAAQKERIVQAYRQIISSKPPEPRRVRGAQP